MRSCAACVILTWFRLLQYELPVSQLQPPMMSYLGQRASMTGPVGYGATPIGYPMEIRHVAEVSRLHMPTGGCHTCENI